MLRVTIIETLAYTIEVKGVDEQTAIAIAKNTFERGDVPLRGMAECSTEYQISDNDSVDMTLDKDGNNLDIPEEYL